SWQPQIFEAANGAGDTAIRAEADVGNIAGRHLALRHIEGPDVSDEIVAGVLTVEQVKELRERFERHAFIELKGPADAQVNLGKGNTAKHIEPGLLSVDHGAIILDAITVNVYAGSEREGTRTFKLRD